MHLWFLAQATVQYSLLVRQQPRAAANRRAKDMVRKFPLILLYWHSLIAGASTAAALITSPPMAATRITALPRRRHGCTRPECPSARALARAIRQWPATSLFSAAGIPGTSATARPALMSARADGTGTGVATAATRFTLVWTRPGIAGARGCARS